MGQAGQIPSDLFSFIASAPLVALKKKDGGVRPIAVGEIWRRWASKLAARYAQSKLNAPLQLGVGVPNGCEAIIHAAAKLVDEFGDKPGKAIIKVDFSNAFNTISRQAFLNDIASLCPEIFLFVKQINCAPSIMLAGD